MKRTQIYIGEDQDQRLSERARALGTTKSDLIREAIDDFLGTDDDGNRLLAFRRAVEAAAGSASHLPSGRDYVDQVREADDVRAQTLENRRRS